MIDLFSQRVLVVEDESPHIELVELHLKSVSPWTFDIQTCGTLAKAVELIEHSTDFDIVLLDLGLPDSQGLQGVSTLQSLRPDMAIVILTCQHDWNLAGACLKAGAQDFLFKPEDMVPRILVRALSWAVERQRLRNVLHNQSSVVEESFNKLKRLVASLPGNEVLTELRREEALRELAEEKERLLQLVREG